MEFIPFIKSSTMLVAVLGIAMWTGFIWEAEGEEKLVESCAPINFATNAQHNLVASIVGSEPQWTSTVQRYLMSRCYYMSRRLTIAIDKKQHKNIRVAGVRL